MQCRYKTCAHIVILTCKVNWRMEIGADLYKTWKSVTLQIPKSIQVCSNIIFPLPVSYILRLQIISNFSTWLDAFYLSVGDTRQLAFGYWILVGFPEVASKLSRESMTLDPIQREWIANKAFNLSNPIRSANFGHFHDLFSHRTNTRTRTKIITNNKNGTL